MVHIVLSCSVRQVLTAYIQAFGVEKDQTSLTGWHALISYSYAADQSSSWQ